MSDLNFFSSYYNKRRKVLNKSTMLYSFIIVFIVSIITFVLLNVANIRKLNNEVNILKEKYKTLSNYNKIEDIKNREQYIKLTKEKLEILNILDKYIEEKSLIYKHLLESIRESLPENVFLDSILANTESIRIEGKAKNNDFISQFQCNLNENEIFNKAFISEIKYEEGFYIFCIDIILGEEKAIGTDVQNN